MYICAYVYITLQAPYFDFIFCFFQYTGIVDSSVVMMLMENTLQITFQQDQLIIIIHLITICYTNLLTIFHTEPVVLIVEILVFVIFIINLDLKAIVPATL